MDKIRAWFRHIPAQIISTGVFTMLITAGTALWAHFEKLTPFWIFIISLCVMALVIIIINQVDAFFQRRNKTLFQQSYKYIDMTLREWLYKRGYSVQNDAQPGSEFQFIIRDQQQRQITVAKLKDSDDLLIQTTIKLNTDETEQISELDTETQRKLINDLQVSLSKQQVQYLDLKLPLETISMVAYLVLDKSFSRDVFLEAIDRVRNGRLFVRELLSSILKTDIVNISKQILKPTDT